jgi:hypothetical protein
LIFIKLFISILTAFSFIKLLSTQNKELSTFKICEVLVFVFFYSVIFLKVKAYSISVALVCLEISFLIEYSKSKNLKTVIKLLILCILWNNLHSGSIPVFFVIAGVYWLTLLKRDKIVLLYGFLFGVSLGLNPYSYKMIVFDMMHNFNSTMKIVVKEWKTVDAKTGLGIAVALLFLLVIFNLYYTARENINIEYILLFCIFFYMTMGSVRHFIYCIPFAILIIINSEFDFKFNLDLKYFVFAFSLLLILISYSTFTCDYNTDYAMNYVTDELANYLVETNSDTSDGLFCDYNTISAIPNEYGIKTFVGGAYPLTSGRTNDMLTMISYASSSQEESMIDYYGLTKFVFFKYNLDVEYYTITSPLYDYLSTNDEYVQLYDDDFIVYFVRKDILE